MSRPIKAPNYHICSPNPTIRLGQLVHIIIKSFALGTEHRQALWLFEHLLSKNFLPKECHPILPACRWPQVQAPPFGRQRLLTPNPGDSCSNVLDHPPWVWDDDLISNVCRTAWSTPLVRCLPSPVVAQSWYFNADSGCTHLIIGVRRRGKLTYFER